MILADIVRVLKAVAILTSKHLNLSTIFVVSAKVWLNLGFGTQKKCPVQMFTFTRCFSRALSVYAASDRMPSRSMQTKRLV